MLKKVLIAVCALVGLIVIAAITVPFFVDVDKYRPQIVQQADQHLNGKLELGKLSLSLWGQIRIEIASLKLSDQEGRQVIAVNDAYFHLPFSSILSGSPSLVLRMSHPELDVVKDKTGKLNVISLVKTENAPSSKEREVKNQAAANAPAQPQAGGGGQLALPSIATRATLGLDLANALIKYKDETTGMSTELKDLNARIENLSLSREMTLEITADLDTHLKGEKGEAGLSVVGPAKITGKANPTVSGGRFERVNLTAHADMDQVEIEMPELFHKKPGVAAHADLEVAASPAEATIERLDVVFFNADVKSSGKLTHLNDSPQPVVAYQVKSNRIELKPWSELVPMLKDYELGGVATLSAEAHGPADKLAYQGDVKVEELTAKAGNLKAQPRINADLSVVPDKADLKATMRAPGNELSLAGNVISFTRPQIRLDIASSGMDLDQLIAFPQQGAAAAKTGAPAASGAPSAAQASKEDLDAKLAPLRANKSLALAQAHINMNIKSLKAQGVMISDMAGKASLQSLVGSIDSFSMKLFGGQIKSSASVDLKPKTPDYRFSANVANLDMAEAVASQMKMFKNTVTGKLNLEASGTGKSFNTDPAIENLNAKGKLKIDNAAFTSIDVGKMVADGINNAMGNIAGKIPGLQGKNLSAQMPSGGSHYDSITSSFTIANGHFDAPDFTTKAAPNKGIDLKGDTNIDLKTKALHANWEVIDTYNLTHAKDISVNQMGVQVPHLLAEGNGPVKFPITVTGTLDAPQYSYNQVVEALVKVALNNTTGALKGQAKAQLQNQAKGLLKQAPPQLQNQLKNLFGG